MATAATSRRPLLNTLMPTRFCYLYSLRMLLTRFSRLMWRATGRWRSTTLMSSFIAATPPRGGYLWLRLTSSRFFGQRGRRPSLNTLLYRPLSALGFTH
ncbi:uncharacterized protein M421DRAFT_399658 [Didymella exigua CBS 183.55]|uniref:Uncharacterized protein n=1 Tax=Didymella exigua CBS 183.55 TaxID=1150837 RepID=A0A6A5RX93_9PLEO|nr:uncharacterized protein M421DRAFT_399658 [Didymella exigua CBS 183.55]KAF1933105.1 hypothetical protein M421DRAFT_399658 [Didymella exigua CBS 183.55]